MLSTIDEICNDLDTKNRMIYIASHWGKMKDGRMSAEYDNYCDIDKSIIDLDCRNMKKCFNGQVPKQINIEDI